MPVSTITVGPLQASGMSTVGFVPSQITGLVAWYDAQTIGGIASGASVSAWTDKSGFNFHVTQASAVSRPTYISTGINGNPVVRFNVPGNTLNLTNSSFTDFGDNYTAFAVFSVFTTATNSGGIFEVTNGTVNTGFGMLWNPLMIWRSHDSTANRGDTDSAVSDGIPRQFTGICNGSAGSTELRINGTSINTGPYVSPNPNTLNTIVIGRLTFTGFDDSGDIGEILIYNRTLTGTEIPLVESYMTSRWGI